MELAQTETISGGRLNIFARYPELILVVVSSAAWFILRPIQISHDVYWQFWVARQLLGGSRLYTDIWEVNPPLWFWSAMPIQWLSMRLGIAWQSLLIGLVIFLSAVSAGLVKQLISLNRPRDSLCLMVIIFWILAIVPLSDVGQRENLSLIGALPYVALIARRHAGKSTPVVLAIVVGLLGAYGFSLKHYFVIIPIVLEIWLWLHQRKSWQPWRPEILMLIGVALIYTASVIILTPEFFTLALPMIRISYSSYNSTILSIILTPWVILWIYQTIYLLTVLKSRSSFKNSEAENFFRMLAVVAICYCLAYFMQQKGPYYHSIPTAGILTILISLQLFSLRQISLVPVVFGISLLIFSLSTKTTPLADDYAITKLSRSLLREVPAGKSVFIASANPRMAWPTVEQRHLIWPLRMSSFWMMSPIALGDPNGPNSLEIKNLSSKIHDSIYEDLLCNPPVLIAVQKVLFNIGKNKKFVFMDFLLEDYRLKYLINNNYQIMPSKDFDLYVIKSLVVYKQNKNCRIVS
jgi:hypothetical protein